MTNARREALKIFDANGIKTAQIFNAKTCTEPDQNATEVRTQTDERRQTDNAKETETNMTETNLRTLCDEYHAPNN